jgi:amidophosphoribosyltransferase
MDTGRRSELLAADLSVGEIADYLKVDSLAYLDLDRVTQATGAPAGAFCTACLSGEYPVPVPLSDAKHVLEKPAWSGSGMPAPDAEPTLVVGDADITSS